MRVLLSILVSSLLLMSCRKDFDEINTNPNAPTTADIDYLFTNALLKGGGQFSTGTHTNVWTMMIWTQQMADINGITNPSNAYAYSDDWNDELWKEWYADVLSPTNSIIELSKDDPFLVNKHSLARIWRAYTMQRITDLWGDIPYFEALKGYNESGEPILQPAYDSQQEIYADLLKEVKEATEALDPNMDNYYGADVLYNGDLTKWTRFANSLRLRMAMRIIDADPTLASQHINEVMALNDFISSTNESAEIVYNGVVQSPFYALESSGQGMRNPSHFFARQLVTTNDPRISIYLEDTPYFGIFGTNQYVGVPNLMTSTQLNSNGITAFSTSKVGSAFLTMDAPVVIMSYAEVSFLKAEAIYRGFSGAGSMQSFYEDGIRSAMEEINLPSDSATVFLANGGAFDGTLEQLITQKWITFAYKDGFEAFAEYRRTGFPTLLDFSNNPVDPMTVPKRFEYPLSELSLNGANVSQVGVGINDFYTPVWWNQ